MCARVHRTPAQLDPISRLLGFLVFLSSARPRQTRRALRLAIGPCLFVSWAALSICLLRSDQRCLALPQLATTSNPVEFSSSCPEVRMSSTMRRSHLVSVQLANGVFKHPPLHLHYCLASSNIPPQKSSPPVCVHACTHVRASQRSRTRGAFIAHAPNTCTYATHPTRKTHGGFTTILCSPSNV